MSNKTQEKTDIRNISFLELKEKIISLKEQPYKSKQVFEWIWKKSKTNFDSMRNISSKTKKN